MDGENEAGGLTSGKGARFSAWSPAPSLAHRQRTFRPVGRQTKHRLEGAFHAIPMRTVATADYVVEPASDRAGGTVKNASRSSLRRQTSPAPVRSALHEIGLESR
jgi:hypothetical protein